MQTLLTRRNRFGGEAEKMVGAEGAMASHPQRPRVCGRARPSVVCKATVCGTRTSSTWVVPLLSTAPPASASALQVGTQGRLSD